MSVTTCVAIATAPGTPPPRARRPAFLRISASGGRSGFSEVLMAVGAGNAGCCFVSKGAAAHDSLPNRRDNNANARGQGKALLYNNSSQEKSQLVAKTCACKFQREK